MILHENWTGETLFETWPVTPFNSACTNKQKSARQLMSPNPIFASCQNALPRKLFAGPGTNQIAASKTPYCTHLITQ
jgi:hypothetical protein